MGVYVSICLPLIPRDRRWGGGKWWCLWLVSCPLCQGAVAALPAVARQLRHCCVGVCRSVPCTVWVSLPTAEHVFLPLCSLLPCVYNRALLCQCESSSVNFSSGDTEDRGRKDPVPRRRSWRWWQSHSLVVSNFPSSDYLPFIASGEGGLTFSDARIQLFLCGPTAGWPGEQWGAASQRLVSMETALSWVLWDVASPG